MPIRHRIPAALVPILLGFATLVAAPLAVTSAYAQQDPRAQAKLHYTSGKKLFEQGEYEKAIAEFRSADQLAPSGVNDFNIGLAYEALGQPDEALRYYRSYLQRVPDASNRATVEASIGKLEATIAAEADARRAEEDARRLAAEEEARRIEADKGIGTTAPPRATGDPELDRVAAVDVAQVRDRGQVATIGGGGGAAAGGTGAVGPPPEGTGAGAPPPPPPGGEPPKSKPVYKKWWFWVVVGVSAYVLISIITADSDDAQPLQGDVRRDRMMPMPVGSPSGGATLWRF